MPPQIHTTDKVNMAERTQVSALLWFFLFDVCEIFDACRLTSDYQRIKEIT